MKTLITGGAGFIDSHLADLLGRPNGEFVLGSILNAELVDSLALLCDRIFHLAGAVGVHVIVEKPLESMQTNIRG